ncbi:MAG: glycosyl hydrolase family 28-related protein [Pseudomonadota bacterium]
MNRHLRHSALSIISLAFVSLACVPVAQAYAAGFKGCNATPTSKLTVNVKSTGAKGDGQTDDTKAIQRAIDKVAGTGGTVYVPAGTYRVRAEYGDHLVLKSKMTFKMAPKATLKMFPMRSHRYAVLFIPGSTDVIVSGGTLHGDRHTHKGRGGEKGMGIRIEQGAKRITVRNVKSKLMWGDGFNLREGEDIALCSVRAERNRRQGLSIIEGKRILVTKSVFRDTQGTRPSAGIDIEPFKKGQEVSHVRIERSEFANNDGGGVMIAGKWGTISKVQIQNNRFGGPRPLFIEYAPRVAGSHICSNKYNPLSRIDMKMFEKVSRPKHTIGMQKPCKGEAKRRIW